MATYKINVRRYYYGPRETVEEHLDNETGQPWRGTHKEARAEAHRIITSGYELVHNEYSVPTYRIAIAKD